MKIELLLSPKFYLIMIILLVLASITSLAGTCILILQEPPVYIFIILMLFSFTIVFTRLSLKTIRNYKNAKKIERAVQRAMAQKSVTFSFLEELLLQSLCDCPECTERRDKEKEEKEPTKSGSDKDIDKKDLGKK